MILSHIVFVSVVLVTFLLLLVSNLILAMSQSLSSLSDPFVTVITGVLVFSIGHAIVKLAIEPIQEMAELRGKIAEDLSYYANKTTATDLATGEERIEVGQTYREKASLLSAKTHKIPMYRLWDFIGIVPNKEDVIEARANLFGLSNKVQMNNSSGNYEMMEEIKQQLDLDLK